jgi:UDP-hydrolysing UDP-N-acetyl-D-glucosamine 2-epimerase
MRKITFIVNSRSNWALIKPIITNLDRHLINPIVILGSAATESRFSEIETDLIALNLEIYHAPSEIIGHNTMALSLAPLITQTEAFLRRIRPDVVLIVGDRFETLAAAICARMHNITLVHVQGGEVSGCVDDYVRNALSAMADYHYPATSIAERRLKNRYAHEKKNVFNLGCPSLDIIKDAVTDEQRLQLALSISGTGRTVSIMDQYVIVLQHPDTTESLPPRAQIQPTIDAICNLTSQVLWLYPNIDAGSDEISKALRQLRDSKPHIAIQFATNFPPEVFVGLLQKAYCLIGNSSTGIRLCPLLGLSAINIGDRQKGREQAGNVINTGYVEAEICQAVIWVKPHQPSHLYGSGTSGWQIAQHLVDIVL